MPLITKFSALDIACTHCGADIGEQCSGDRLCPARISAARESAKSGRIAVEVTDSKELMGTPFMATYTGGKCKVCEMSFEKGQLIRASGYTGYVHAICVEDGDPKKPSRTGYEQATAFRKAKAELSKKRARELRAEGMTQKQIAQRMGCGLSTVGNWLKDAA